jgi:5-methylcytosine-specific restriction endonuclease McrA
MTLRTACSNCGKSIPTETGHAHPLDEAVSRETWGLVGRVAGRKAMFPTCTDCHDAAWTPAEFASTN